MKEMMVLFDEHFSLEKLEELCKIQVIDYELQVAFIETHASKEDISNVPGVNKIVEKDKLK